MKKLAMVPQTASMGLNLMPLTSASQKTLGSLLCKELFREYCYLHTVSKEINAMVFKFSKLSQNLLFK